MSKQSERLFACLSGISDQAIDQAAQSPRPRRRPLRWAAAAAALVLAAGTGLLLLPRMGASSGGSGHDGEASAFMSYAGPVFPLTLREENSAISARRDITLDLAPWVPEWISNQAEADSRTHLTAEEQADVLESYNKWYPEGGRYVSSTDILVTDSYTLTNHADTEQTLRVLYPFAASLMEAADLAPVLTLDGTELDTELHVGSYSGGFEGAWGTTLFTEETPGSVNLDYIESWEGYRALLSGGGYLQTALGEPPDLTGIPVVVYRFTDPYGPERSDAHPNPSIRASFTLDHDKTTVLSSGFHAMRQDAEQGTMTQGFSIPRPGQPDHEQPYYLIVLGEDIQSLTTGGYATGGTDADTPALADAGVTVTRYETDLDTILRQVLTQWEWWETPLGFETHYAAFRAYLCAHGLLSDAPKERYSTGWLTDLVSDAGNVSRVLYLEAELTLPAGQSATLSAAMVKHGSYDFYCAHTKNQGVYGYDLVTRLGSNLTCAAQTATLLDHGQINIVRQNFGFDLAQGIRTVALSPETEHYYLEVARAAAEQ